jgi:hypothetical protein
MKQGDKTLPSLEAVEFLVLSQFEIGFALTGVEK